MAKWELFRYNVKRPGTPESLVVSGLSTLALLGGGIAATAAGAQARGRLNDRTISDEERKRNEGKSFLLLLGAVLLMVGILSAVWFGKNLLARQR
uniref:Uncharacterized protein n=1 Tax=viral metagenome TaxID=1070528 RepID=A0A6C0BNK3_9ZZZZ